jgi:hypothetical protein
MFGSYFPFSSKKLFSKSTAGGRFAQPVIVVSAISPKIKCVFKRKLPNRRWLTYRRLQRLVE